jgi:hypothetical protein
MEIAAAAGTDAPAAKRNPGRPRSDEHERRKAYITTWQASASCAEGFACIGPHVPGGLLRRWLLALQFTSTGQFFL